MTMKILQNDASTLVLHHQQGAGIKRFILIWASLFTGVPLVLLVGLLQSVGVISLSCERTVQGEIRCEKRESKVLGLSQPSPLVIEQMTGAQLKTVEGRDSDGDRTMDYSVQFNTKTAPVAGIEGFIRINGVKGSLPDMQEWVDSVNTFVDSNQSTLHIQRNNPANVWHILLPVAFLSIFEGIGFLVLYSVFRTDFYSFDRYANRLLHEQQTLLGRRSQQYPIREITGVRIITKTDSDGDSYYELNLLPEAIYPQMLMSSRNRKEVEYIQTTLQTFLNLD